MLKKVISFAIVFLLLLSLLTPVFAKTTYIAPSPKPTPVPIVNSFEMFWPLSAGKTVESKVYFLKTLKEKIRGALIFGKQEKADYDVFLGVKRMLEAESLIKANRNDLANLTLDKAVAQFDAASANIDAAKSSGEIPQNIKDEINIRVANLKKFTNYLINQNKDYKDKLQIVLDRLNSISSKI